MDTTPASVISTSVAKGEASPPVSDFLTFLQGAKPLVVEPVRISLAAMKPKVARLRRWLVSHDLLRVARVTAQEDPYTELVAWALHPNTHPESALARQRAWLRMAPFADELDVREAAVPRTQVGTGDGVPDLLLVYDTCAVVVEAKTQSAEHKVPSGQYQTVAYPDAVRRQLGVPLPVYVAFLTPNGRPARNAEAYNTTFAAFCMAMMSVLDGYAAYRMSPELRAAYALLFTHLLTCASPVDLDLSAALEAFREWEDRLDDDLFLVRRLNDIATFTADFEKLCNGVSR